MQPGSEGLEKGIEWSVLTMESYSVEIRQSEQAFYGNCVRTMSPHTTLCLCSPLLVLSVKKPSLPATSSLQSRASSLEIKPASSTCAGFNPKVTHFPIRRFRSDNHRGFKDAVAASASGGSEALRGAVANDRMQSVS